jgi:mannose-6-phosphate isomerase-like protein (cupin superfamily)
METHDLATAIGRLPARPSGAFARLARFNHGGLFLGRFAGQSPWERHRHGDEIVYVLEGEIELTMLAARGERRVTVRAGSLVVVPRGTWHRQLARTPATQLTATPTPTDISWAADPRARRAPAPVRAKPRRARKRAG